jgi:hypothetical protein
MSEFANPASGAQDQAAAYTAAILAALEDRDPIEVLREMPAALRNALAGLTPQQLATPEAPGKWSMAQVVFHLLDSDTVGAYRFRMILAQDRPTLVGYDQDLWVERLHAGTDLDEALEEFTRLRRSNVQLLEGTSSADRERVGVHLERGDESLGHLIRLYAGHDRVHLRQLARIRKAVEAAG